MALVVLLRGVNVGGHRTFRPSVLAKRLKHLDAVSIGAAGTFVVRARVGRAALRAELARRLPFEAGITICRAGELLGLLSSDVFAGHRLRADTVRFVSVLSRSPRSAPSLPLTLPSTGPWLVKLLAREQRLVIGLYRRRMKVIGLLGSLDRIFGTPATTRSWSTLAAIARVLERGKGAGS